KGDVTGVGVCMRSLTLWFEVWQRVPHATIDLGFIANIPAVAVPRMALACLVIDERLPFAAIRQLTGDDLIRESAHKWRKSPAQDAHGALFIRIRSQSAREPECQSLRIRQQRCRGFQCVAPCISVSHGSTGARSSNH